MTTALGKWLTEQVPEKRLHLLRHQPSYFADIGEVKRLRAWLTDFGFLEQKLAVAGITALIEDYDLALPLLSAGEQRTLKLIQGALRLSAHVLAEDNSQLAGQLWGRLLSFSEPEISALLEQTKQSHAKPWFHLLTPTLTPPGGTLLQTFSGHSDWVRAVAITPDGTQVVSGSGDNTLKLWNLQTGEALVTFSGHSGFVRAVAITPDGTQAVSGSDDNTLKLWNLQTGEVLTTFSGHSSSVRAVAITPSGIQAVSGSWDNTLKLWDLQTGEALTTFSGHSGFVRAVAITLDGTQAVSGSDDGTLKLWNLQTGETLLPFAVIVAG
uniref:WD40 repeat domain-containing protein n=1 Tax=Desertifilum tharense IPPAS B-1220 TaxID=1781255 RepID=A0ACD5GUC0_9CYAN